MKTLVLIIWKLLNTDLSVFMLKTVDCLNQFNCCRRVNALTVSSLLLIYPRSLLDSPSLNPFVKPLMELIRFEENVTFAQYALNSIPILFRIASGKNLFLQILFLVTIQILTS